MEIGWVGGEEKKVEVRLPEVSVVSWVNKPDVYDQCVLKWLHPMWGYQRGDVPIEFISIGPEENCKSMGEAYERGRQAARADIICYLHQDMGVTDPSFLLKLQAIARVPQIGMLGFVGSKVDTGASWMHANYTQGVGFLSSNSGQFDAPSMERVALVDGFGCVVMPSMSHLPWPEYRGYKGPHMVVEDMCMRVRAVGCEVWCIDSRSFHLSDGTAGEDYWHSVRLFYDRWCRHFDEHALHPDLLEKDAQRFAARWE